MSVVAFRRPEHSPSARPLYNPAPGGPSRAAEAPAAFHSWVCCVFEQVHFVYIYGLRADCARLAGMHNGTTIQKGQLPTMAMVQQSAEAAAAHLQDIYEGIGSARAMPVREFLRLKHGLNVDRPAWMRGRN